MKPKLQELRLPQPEAAYCRLLQAACKDLGIDESTANIVIGLARARQWSKLIAFAKNVASQEYGDSSEHFRWAQLSSLIIKVPFPGAGASTRMDSAWKKFLRAEHLCKRTNQRFIALNKAVALGHPRLPFAMLSRLERMRSLIQWVIGEKPPLTRIYDNARFGPGASVDLGGDATHLLRKVDALTLVPSAVPFATGLLWQHHQLRTLFYPSALVENPCPKQFGDMVRQRMTLCDYNKIAFVPKNAETDRTIAAEGALLGLLQLGIGNTIADMLRSKTPVDLNDQTRNQHLARCGSLGGPDPITTIDLSAASDSLARELVRYLLPHGWYELLNCCRSPEYVCKQKRARGRYEKFTSMGNGFCFPLESLIFWAAAKACSEECGAPTVGVYGDDIAVHQSCALLLIETLRFCGFRTNVDKTFLFGPFRESCGADFFQGINVRPFVLDYLPDTVQALIKIGNGACQPSFLQLEELRGECIALLPDKYKLLRPWPGPAETAITVPLDQFMASIETKRRWNSSLCTWEWQELRSSPVFDIDRPPQPDEGWLAALGGATAATLFKNRRGELRARPAGSKDKVVVPLFALRRRTTTDVVWTSRVGNPVVTGMVWRELNFRYLRPRREAADSAR